MYSEVCVFDLLHMAEDVLPTVEHSSTLLRVQLVDEISGEVLIGVLIPETHVTVETGRFKGRFLTEPAGDGVTCPLILLRASQKTHTTQICKTKTAFVATNRDELGSITVYKCVIMKLCRCKPQHRHTKSPTHCPKYYSRPISTDLGPAGSSLNSVMCTGLK